MYIPVKEDYTQLWEYYKNDRDILKDISSELLYSNNFFSFLFSVFKVDYVYCWWWHTSILQILISKILRKKVICTGAIHMFDYTGETTFYKKKFLYRLLTKISLYLADVNIFICNDQKNQIVSHLKVNNPKVAYSSLEKNHTKFYSEVEITKDFKNEINITSTLWLTKSTIKRKGLFECLDALELLSQKNFQYFIIGKKGDGYEELKKKIETMKIKNKVKILNDISTDEKNNILMSTDLYLQPSYFEGLGNAVIEAMARGCVPLVSRFSAQPEVVSKHGYIVHDINKEEIANKINYYISLSKERKNLLRAETLNYCHEKFSYVNHLKKIKSIFKDLS